MAGEMPAPALLNLGNLTNRKNLLSGLDVWRYLEIVLMVFYWIAGFFAISMNVFTRKDFGERYLSWINLYAGYLTYGFVALAGAFGAQFRRGGDQGGPLIMQLVGLAFLLISWYHRRVIRQRNKRVLEGKELPMHSLYSGAPLLSYLPFITNGVARPQVLPSRIPWPSGFEESTVKRLIEPAALVLLAWPLGAVSGTLRWWLIVSAAAIALRETIEQYHTRQYVLDMQDAQIEARNVAPAALGKPPRETQGVMFEKSNAALLSNVATVGTTIAAGNGAADGDGAAPLPKAADALPDDLARLLDAPAQPPAAQLPAARPALSAAAPVLPPPAAPIAPTPAAPALDPYAPRPGHPLWGNQPNPNAEKGHEWDHVPGMAPPPSPDDDEELRRYGPPPR